MNPLHSLSTSSDKRKFSLFVFTCAQSEWTVMVHSQLSFCPFVSQAIGSPPVRNLEVCGFIIIFAPAHGECTLTYGGGGWGGVGNTKRPNRIRPTPLPPSCLHVKRFTPCYNVTRPPWGTLQEIFSISVKSDWALQWWSMRKYTCFEAYIRNQYSWLKNNTAKLYFVLGTSELGWIFSSIWYSQIFQQAVGLNHACALLEICEYGGGGGGANALAKNSNLVQLSQIWNNPELFWDKYVVFYLCLQNTFP